MWWTESLRVENSKCDKPIAAAVLAYGKDAQRA